MIPTLVQASLYISPHDWFNKLLRCQGLIPQMLPILRNYMHLRSFREAPTQNACVLQWRRTSVAVPRWVIMYINWITSCVSLPLILNHPQCWLIFGSRLWQRVGLPAFKNALSENVMLMRAVVGGQSSRREWEVGLGVDHWEHPSIICLNRPGGLGSLKNTPNQHVPLILFFYVFIICFYLILFLNYTLLFCILLYLFILF